MAGVSESNVSDEKLKAATGKSREEWHALLDAESASEWAHPQIARWLVEAHGVDGWWAQGITVGYEQARGMRLPGQLADGTFSVTSSKTFAYRQRVTLDLVIAAFTDHFSAAPASVSPEAKHPTARWKFDDGISVLATISPVNGDKSRAALTHLKLTAPDQLEPARAALAEVLDTLATAQNVSGTGRSVD